MLDLLWTARCAGCGAAPTALICDRCAPGRPHRAPAPEGVQGVLTLAGYDSPLGRALRRAKYGPDHAIATALGARLGQALGPLARTADVIVPVPTPASRRIKRGFAFPGLLAGAIGAAAGRPVVEALEITAGDRQARQGTADGRQRNLAGRVRSKRTVRGRILLVDDVLTTGATSAACARELLGDGADEVWLAVLCATRRELS